MTGPRGPVRLNPHDLAPADLFDHLWDDDDEEED